VSAVGDGRLPDFIIGGAMKCGTSTVHQMLGELPGVYIPDPEIYFFSIDDFEQHPEFFVGRDGEWVERDYNGRKDEYLAWYTSFFKDAPAGALIGEDSTSYLHSLRCAERIRALLPAVRLLFLLRDPAERTYSHYWHMVRTGRATEDFEGTLRHAPGTLFQRSHYREGVERYIDTFPADQLKFVLFEDLVTRPADILRAVIDFIGVPQPEVLPPTAHRNPARVPRSINAQLWRNRLFRDRVANRFRGHLPGTARPTGAGEQAVRGRFARWNLRTNRRPPLMRPDTHRFLNALFRRENAGLSGLIGQEVEERWYRDPAG
jgi:sulfotransferase family protein